MVAGSSPVRVASSKVKPNIELRKLSTVSSGASSRCHRRNFPFFEALDNGRPHAMLHRGNRLPKYSKHRRSGHEIATIKGRDHLLGPYGAKASKLEYDCLITECSSSGRSNSFGEVEHSFP